MAGLGGGYLAGGEGDDESIDDQLPGFDPIEVGPLIGRYHEDGAGHGSVPGVAELQLVFSLGDDAGPTVGGTQGMADCIQTGGEAGLTDSNGSG